MTLRVIFLSPMCSHGGPIAKRSAVPGAVVTVVTAAL